MATKIYQCMQKISDAIVENKDFLTDLDREIGDADHGVNMARGFTEVMKQLPEDEEDYGVVLKKVGMVLLSKVGGASGPLYGTAYMKAGAAVKGKTSITLEDAKAMLTEVIGGIKMRGKAVKGEKTMLDALEPALDALTKGIENGDDAETCKGRRGIYKDHPCNQGKSKLLRRPQYRTSGSGCNICNDYIRSNPGFLSGE